ncbi:carboxyltransferase domain-containing protein [Deinococcus oregonensis]|uniref:Carboxyltransferase domain-containing protein n=1 Tax=Deinococcus oregonensis TaxID=1805970 RepID=A0ABV6B5F1_9DEIO
MFSAELHRSDHVPLHALHQALRDDLILGMTNLYVEHEVVQMNRATACERVRTHLPAALNAQHEARLQVKLPVRNGGENLADVAAPTGMSQREVIRLHRQPDSPVSAVAFTPGFPVLREVPETLRLPRQDTPRLKVPFNAVAVASPQSCVDVRPSPGDGHSLGTALTSMCGPGRDAPFLPPSVESGAQRTAAQDFRQADPEVAARTSSDLRGAGQRTLPGSGREANGRASGLRGQMCRGQVVSEATLYGAVQVTPAGQPPSRCSMTGAAPVGIRCFPSSIQMTSPWLPSCGPINLFIFGPTCPASLRVGRAAGSYLREV